MDDPNSLDIDETFPEEIAEEASEPEEVELAEDCTFEDFAADRTIIDSILKLGFNHPTEVQRKAVPRALEGHDVIAQAQTGSGKTLAFVVPLIHALLKASTQNEINYTFGICVVPTRELALQVTQVVNSLELGLKPVTVIGGVDVNQQLKELKNDPRIVVGTPGRLLDLIKQKALRLNQCRFFALDEVDEMLSIGFIEDVRSILSRLPDHRQGMFVSATITPRVEMLANSFLNHPKAVMVEKMDTSSGPAIEHQYCEIGGDLMAKPAALCDIIETLRPRSAIIFCNTKSDTLLVEALLRRRGFDARRINSDLTQAQRDRVMKKIRKGDLQFLVATDIAARGLDIEQIDLVINYAIHEQPEAYIHRTGRTGRAGRRGKAISLVGPRDFGAFHFLTKVLEVKFQKIPIPTDAEVADARLTHLYEMIRTREIEVKERDVLVVRQLLREMGGMTEAPEELEQILAKVTRYTMEHYVNTDAKSLDEELDAAPKPAEDQSRDRSRDDRRGRRDRDGGRDRRRDDRRDARRDDERDDRRGDERRPDDAEGNRGRRDRHEDRDDRRGRRDRRRDDDRAPVSAEGEQNQEGQDLEANGNRGEENRHEHRGHERSEEGRRDRNDRPERSDRRNTPREVRIYIGQGTAQGMTPDLFSNLAQEFGEVQQEDLRSIALREHYGFVDVLEPASEALIRNLNGIEYNGAQLAVELAAVPAERERRPRRDDRRGGRRDGGDDRGRRDRRGGRGGRGDRRSQGQGHRSDDRR